MPGVIEFRYDHVGPYTVLNVYDKHGHSRASKLPSTLPPLYKTMLPISKAKYDDLYKLCRTKVIPQEVQQWYYQLPFQPGVPDKTVEPSVDDSVDDDEDIERYFTPTSLVISRSRYRDIEGHVSCNLYQ